MKPTTSARAVLFDLDGTLVDSLLDIALACDRLLQRRGFATHGVDAYRHFVGDGLTVLMRRILPPDQQHEAVVAECAEAFSADYARSWTSNTKPYPQVDDMLERLAARGTRLAVLSNKPDAFTQRIVASLFKEARFDVVLGATSRFCHKPDPASALHVATLMNLPPADFAYVGDTATDMQTAVRAGMVPVGVLWGFRDANELLAAGARRLLAAPLNLLSD